MNGALGRLEPMTVTSELSIRFLRPAKGDKLHARAHLERKGTTSVVATVRAIYARRGRTHRSRTGNPRASQSVR